MKNENIRINKLILRVAQNNEKALEELFVLTKEKMYHVALKYLYDKNYVDDILSEAYLKVYKYSRSFKKDLNGFNWMHEIIKNLALDHNRNTLKEDNCSFNENFHHSDVTYNPLIKDRNLRIAMKTLTDEEQKIIYLRIWENRTLNDIADSLSANVTFIYRVYTKALEKLKRNLSN